MSSADKVKQYIEDYNQIYIHYLIRKLALNKIGHAMHDIDEVYENIS